MYCPRCVGASFIWLCISSCSKCRLSDEEGVVNESTVVSIVVVAPQYTQHQLQKRKPWTHRGMGALQHHPAGSEEVQVLDVLIVVLI